jgi:hypothetical protein
VKILEEDIWDDPESSDSKDRVQPFDETRDIELAHSEKRA